MGVDDKEGVAAEVAADVEERLIGRCGWGW